MCKESHDMRSLNKILLVSLLCAFRIDADLVVLYLHALLCSDSKAVLSTEVNATNFKAASIVPRHLNLVNADPVHEVAYTTGASIQVSNFIYAPDLTIDDFALMIHELKRLCHLASSVPAQIESLHDHAAWRGHLNLIRRVDFDLSVQFGV